MINAAYSSLEQHVELTPQFSGMARCSFEEKCKYSAKRWRNVSSDEGSLVVPTPSKKLYSVQKKDLEDLHVRYRNHLAKFSNTHAMVGYIPPPDYRSLLPPLLACLPTAFVSPRAPPALLPLLSPILRQRVQLLAATSSSASDSWLPLLCWESEPAKRLVDIVSESDAFELHPVSGEIDFGDVENVIYMRLDEETLQAKVTLTDLGLIIIYVWCDGDQEGGGNGWRVSEIRPSEGDMDTAASKWCPTITDADEKARENMLKEALRQGEDHLAMYGINNDHNAVGGEPGEEDDDDNDDDDYWAQYDKTPATQETPVPSSNPNKHIRTTSDAEYFDRYAHVQPEMDNDDTSEDRGAIGKSTLNGNIMASSMRMASEHDNGPFQGTYVGHNSSKAGIADEGISHPAASPPAGSAAVSRLEESAESQSIAEVAVKQHVSTSIKSLFRLCRSSGMERSDFDRMVRTELETLSMMEDDD